MTRWRTARRSEVWCNSEQGATPLDLQAILKTARVLDTQGLAGQADRIVFWKPITDAAKGSRGPEAFEKWLAKVPGPRDLLAALPLDPFSRLRLPAVLGEVIPRLEGLQGLLPVALPKAPPAQAGEVVPASASQAASHQGSLF